jgi:hypothetical protein
MHSLIPIIAQGLVGAPNDPRQSMRITVTVVVFAVVGMILAGIIRTNR